MSEDRIYAQPLSQVGDFVFDERVVEVFPDMIGRSVPGYSSVVSMTGELAPQYAADGEIVYDLGCSLGACTLPMAMNLPSNCKIHAIDSSEAMIRKLSSRLSDLPQDAAEVLLTEADIVDLEFQPSSFVVMNFTLQFIPLEQRKDLLRRIAAALKPGGALILSEKVRFFSEDEQHLMTELHHAFKKANGYSALEISQKRSALENSMFPEAIEDHRERVISAGFSQFSCWFRCFNFVSMLAIK
ncbi:MAG: carboxy-S-adenosyl-L-methionine synthase CmoA [Planctomycetota bacterium]